MKNDPTQHRQGSTKLPRPARPPPDQRPAHQAMPSRHAPQHAGNNQAISTDGSQLAKARLMGEQQAGRRRQDLLQRLQMSSRISAQTAHSSLN